MGKFVEFFGDGLNSLSLPDRATISNMAPEYGATTGFFPVDKETLFYLRQTGRSEDHVKMIEEYLKAQKLFVEDQKASDSIQFSDILELDLSTVKPCLAGPKRPQDRVSVSDVKKEFQEGLSAPVSFKAYGIPKEK